MQKTFRFLKYSGKKAIALLCVSVVLAIAVVGTTLAFITMMTEHLTVQFRPATVSVEKSEDGKGVVNDGEIAVYARVALIFTWESTTEENSIMSSAPVAGVNYSFSVGEDWVKAADGFWYCREPLAPGEISTVVSSTALIGNAPAGHDLSVELLIDAIQADPADAVTESWDSGVSSVDEDGRLVLKTN